MTGTSSRAKGALYGDDANAKEAARATLVHCLDVVLRLMHPFMPFISEEIGSGCR